MPSNLDILAKKIYEYHQLHHQLKKSDLILVPTSNDLRVAEYAAKLYQEGWAPKILFSGDCPARADDIRMTHWGMPEAEKFKEVAVANGVPERDIIVENKSRNSGEIVRFSYAMLKELNIIPHSVIFVEKPFMQRRVWAIFKKQWPDPTTEAIVTSPPIAYEDYPNADIAKEDFINVMVGDLQRIIEYPKLGYQIEQEVPDYVREAYQELVKMGYTNSLI
ncbi:MAG: YdcF family protein [Patescibacteria group bacterium]